MKKVLLSALIVVWVGTIGVSAQGTLVKSGVRAIQTTTKLGGKTMLQYLGRIRTIPTGAPSYIQNSIKPNQQITMSESRLPNEANVRLESESRQWKEANNLQGLDKSLRSVKDGSKRLFIHGMGVELNSILDEVTAVLEEGRGDDVIEMVFFDCSREEVERFNEELKRVLAEKQIAGMDIELFRVNSSLLNTYTIKNTPPIYKKEESGSVCMYVEGSLVDLAEYGDMIAESMVGEIHNGVRKMIFLDFGKEEVESFMQKYFVSDFTVTEMAMGIKVEMTMDKYYHFFQEFEMEDVEETEKMIFTRIFVTDKLYETDKQDIVSNLVA